MYDTVTHGDVVEYLSEPDLNVDCFISADVFTYVGDLSNVFRLIKSRNSRRGKLVFSTEHTEGVSFFLETSGRYSHSKNYIESLCDKYGYYLSHFEKAKLRKEKDEFLRGALYILDFWTGPSTFAAKVLTPYIEPEELSLLDTGWGSGNVADLQLSFLYELEDNQ